MLLTLVFVLCTPALLAQGKPPTKPDPKANPKPKPETKPEAKPETKPAAPAEPKIVLCQKFLDLARRMRSKGKYDVAVAAYREARNNATTKEIEVGVVLEMGEVLEVQEKYKKALENYSQVRAKKAEIELCDRLELYQRGLEAARFYGDVAAEGRMLLGLRSYKDALKAFQKSGDRFGEAKALQALGFKDKAAAVYASCGQHAEAGKVLLQLERKEEAAREFDEARKEYEKEIIRLVNDIRALRAKQDPARRAELKLPPLDEQAARTLRLRLARLYMASADTYENLADVHGRLGNIGERKKLLETIIRFLQLHREAITDEEKDQFGIDRLKKTNFFERVGKLRAELKTGG
jgi:tetratricopeptide (TPR) repeat protein